LPDDQKVNLATLRGVRSKLLLEALGRRLAIDGHRIDGVGHVDPVEQGCITSSLDVEVVLANDRVAIVALPLAQWDTFWAFPYVHIIDVQRPDISQLLNLSRAFLALGIGHIQIQLFHSTLNRIPSGQPRSEVNISCDAEICGVDDFIGAWVVEDGLSVDTSLVGEGAESGNVVVEGNVDFDSLGDQVLELLQLVELVLALDVLGVGDNHAGHESTKRSNSVPLANSKNAGVDVGRAGLQSTVCIRDGASSVVMEMGLDITRDDTTESTDQVVDLTGRSATNSVGNALIAA
jgi:hypothetical protein